jgi:hypothetical protein
LLIDSRQRIRHRDNYFWQGISLVEDWYHYRKAAQANSILYSGQS